MNRHYFLSYSRATGADFAARLCDDLMAGPPSYNVWLDVREMKPDRDWDKQIADAISTCDSLLLVMTRDSVDDQSVCKREWTHALRYKKPIVPLRLHADAELPLRLYSLHYIDFTGRFEVGLAQLRLYLRRLASPEGRLETLQQSLRIAQYDLDRATDPVYQARSRDDIELLERQIADQQRLVDDPQEAIKQTEESIGRGIERERQPSELTTDKWRRKIINQPQSVPPSYFQDRFEETKLVGEFLQDAATRMMTVIGRGGTGKTALVYRLLSELEGGMLPDKGGKLEVDGIIYLSSIGLRQISFPNLFADLVKLLPEAEQNKLETTYKNPQVSTAAKMQALLAAFPTGRIVMVLDNFEDLIDPASLSIIDAELEEALRAILEAPQHALKVIITTRVIPRELALFQPGRQKQLYLDEGLPSPHAENLLREKDEDGKVGLKTASNELLAAARERTRGYPRALEALFAILAVDRDTTLEDILNSARPLPENIVKDLVGEAFSRLDPAAQQVVTALAIYGRPVTATAVDYLLQPFAAGVDSAPILKRLVNWLFVHKEAGRYSLHPEDRAFALSRVPKGAGQVVDDGKAGQFTQPALQRRGADYFRETRMPAASWKTIADLEPQRAEFDLRCAGEDYETAAGVLLQISPKLFNWGHYRPMVDMHERLLGRLEYERPKTIALNLLGLAYWKLGYLRKASEVFEEALKISRVIKDYANESSSLNNLGLIYDEMGKPARAIERYREALGVAKLIHSGTGAALNNLGRSHSDVGETVRGIRFCSQSVTVCRLSLDHDVEAIALCNVGLFLMELGELEKAIYVYLASIAKADAIDCLQVQHYGRYRLALAYLLSDDLNGSLTTAEAASEYEIPNDYKLKALLGLILLKRGDVPGAQHLFAEAVSKATAMMEFSVDNCEAVEVKALALCGLAACGDTSQVAQAIETYKTVRSIHQSAGAWAGALRLFEILAGADKAATLAPVHDAVFSFAVKSNQNLFQASEFLEYTPTHTEVEFVTPRLSPRKEWVNTYFGLKDQPAERTLEFHRIIEADRLIDVAEFREFVTKNRNELGSLLIHPAGLLEILSTDGYRRKMVFATEETIDKLLSL